MSAEGNAPTAEEAAKSDADAGGIATFTLDIFAMLAFGGGKEAEEGSAAEGGTRAEDDVRPLGLKGCCCCC